MKHILIVDDDRSIRHILKEALNGDDFKVEIAIDGSKALEKIKQSEFNLVISDLMMPGMSGVELLENALKINPALGFIIMTAYGTVETAVDALKKGAFDFVTKPLSISQMESHISRFFEFQGLKEENKSLKKQLSDDKKYRKLIGVSDAMNRVRHQIGVVAKSDAPVFIQGESGTGKELIAEAIHKNSHRCNQPYLKVNCSAIPNELIESTLFGHEKGAFTSAVKQHKGLFEEANSGTLLLDEIVETPVAMQAKLLRVLQEGTLNRVGSSKEIKIDVRVIATSNRNILQEIEERNFREDLYYRLNVFPIKISPLRDRPDDIPILLEHFLQKLQSKYQFDKKEFAPDVPKNLFLYNWPGNVRQLENLLERAVFYSGQEPVLTMDHFNLESDRDSLESNGNLNLAPMTIAEMEKKLIFTTLSRTNDNRTQTAEILGVSVRTLRNKLHQYENEGDSTFTVSEAN